MTITFDQFKHGSANTSAGRLHYSIGGEGETVVLIHGYPQYSLQWHAVAPKLAESYCVLVPDLPGCGGSDIPRNGKYDKKSMSEAIGEIVDQLDLGPVRVVGHDHGAGVAYNYACRGPDHVTHLAFCEYLLPGCGYESMMTPGPDWNVGAQWQIGLFTIPDLAEFAFRGRERELLTWFIWHSAHNPFAISNDHIQRYVDALSRPGVLRAGFEQYAAAWQDMDDNKKSMQTKLKMPVIGIGGRASAGEYVGHSLGMVAENVQIAVIEEAGHWISDENPDEFARVLLEFFKA